MPGIIGHGLMPGIIGHGLLQVQSHKSISHADIYIHEKIVETAGFLVVMMSVWLFCLPGMIDRKSLFSA